VHLPEGATCVVPALDVGDVTDTTGAGDAFAAGVLTSVSWRTDPGAACALGHRAAARLLSSRPRI
jgi:sugar/nucleoside kinase (ribokinase family)